MAYCTSTDLANLVGGTQILAELTNDTAGSSEIDTAVVTAMIAKADALIDSILGTRYTVPFSPIPEQVKQLSSNLAIYFCFFRRYGMTDIPKVWVETKKEMDALLDGLSNGTRYVVTVSQIGDDMVTKTTYPTFDFSNESGNSAISDF